MHLCCKNCVVKRATGLITRLFVISLFITQLLDQVLSVLKILFPLSFTLMIPVFDLSSYNFRTWVLPILLDILNPSVPHIIREVASLHLCIFQVLLVVPLILSSLVLLVELLDEILLIGRMLVRHRLSAAMFLIDLFLHLALDLLSIRNVLLMLSMQLALSLLSLQSQVMGHLILLLLFKLRVQVKADFEFTEARQVCLLFFKLFKGKFLLSAPVVIICHEHWGLSLRDCLLIVTNHFGTCFLWSRKTLPNAHRRLGRNFTVQIIICYYIRILFKQWPAALPTTTFDRVGPMVRHHVISLGLLVGIFLALEKPCDVNFIFLLLHESQMIAIGKLDVNLSVDFIFNLI